MRPEHGILIIMCICVVVFVAKELPSNISFKPCNCFRNISETVKNFIPGLGANQNMMLHQNDVSNLPVKPPRHLRTPLMTKMKCSKKYRLLIMVTSHPGGFERRSNIRSTWGNTWHHRTDLPSWKTIFQLGWPVWPNILNETQIEAKKHKDMIFGNFTDIFYKLPVKVIMGFEWATKYCDFDFLLKTDDDVFVNIPNVFKFLSEPDIPRHRLYAGNVHFQTYAIRYRHTKYYVNILEYPYRKYPRFTSGGGMVFSQDVAAGMVNIHNNSNYFKLDDVYIGMLALRLGVDAHHDDWFQLFKGANDCKCEEKTIVRHGAENKDCMEKLYNCFPNLHENYAGFVIKEK